MKTNLYDLIKDLDTQKAQLHRDGWTYLFLAAKTGGGLARAGASEIDDMIVLAVQAMCDIYDNLPGEKSEKDRNEFARAISNTFLAYEAAKTRRGEKMPDMKS